MMSFKDQGLDEVILQVFEEHEESFHFPVATQKEARAFVKALHVKGLSYDCLLPEIKELEQNFSAWRKGISRPGIGNRVIERINRPLQEILLSDGEEEDSDYLDQLSTDSDEIESNHSGIEMKKNGDDRLAAYSKSNLQQTGNGTVNQKHDKDNTCSGSTFTASCAKENGCQSLGNSSLEVYDKAIDDRTDLNGKTEAGKDVLEGQTKQGSCIAENETTVISSGKSIEAIGKKREAVIEKKQETVTEKEKKQETAAERKGETVTEQKEGKATEMKQQEVAEKKQEAVAEKKQAVAENRQVAATDNKQPVTGHLLDIVTDKNQVSLKENKLAVKENEQGTVIEETHKTMTEDKQAVAENKQVAFKKEATAEKKQEVVTRREQGEFIEKKQETGAEKYEATVTEKKQAVTEIKPEAVIEKKQVAITEKKQGAVIEKKQETTIADNKQAMVAEKKQAVAENKPEAVTGDTQEAATEMKCGTITEVKQETVTENKQAVVQNKQAAFTETKQTAVENEQVAVTEKKHALSINMQKTVTETKQDAVTGNKQEAFAEEKQTPAVTKTKNSAIPMNIENKEVDLKSGFAPVKKEVQDKCVESENSDASLAGGNCESQCPKKEIAGIASQCKSQPPSELVKCETSLKEAPNMSNAPDKKLEVEEVSVVESVESSELMSHNRNSEIDSKVVEHRGMSVHTQLLNQAHLPEKKDTNESMLDFSGATDGDSSKVKPEKLQHHPSTSGGRCRGKLDDILESYDSDFDDELNHDAKSGVTIQSDESSTTCCKPRATNESQVDDDSAGYVYAFTDSSAEKDKFRVKVGASRFPHKKLQQSLLFNIDMRLVSAVQVSDRQRALIAVHQKLNVFSIPKTVGWFCGPLESILNVLMAVAKDYPHQD